MQRSLTNLRHVPTASLPALALVAAFGSLGFVGGHVLTYEATGHAHTIEGTHAYLPHLGLLGAGMAIVAILVLLALLVRTSTRAGAWVSHADRFGTRRLVGVSLPPLVFIVVEVVENSQSAHAVAVLPDLRLLALGAVLQGVLGLVALAVARLALRALEHIAAVLLSRSPRNRRAPRTRRRFPHVSSRRLHILATRLAGRGPPHACLGA